MDKARDLQLHSTSKGGLWHFGIKAHIGADSATGAMHSASATAANVHDRQQLDKLLHGDESILCSDRAYASHKEALKAKAPKTKEFTNKRTCRNKLLSERDKEMSRTKSQTRVKIEHLLLTLKLI